MFLLSPSLLNVSAKRFSVRTVACATLGFRPSSSPHDLRNISSIRTATMSTIASESPASKFRLPTNVKPTHYDLTIRTDLDKLTFDGTVTVSLDVKEETKTIVMNSSKLKLGQATAYTAVSQSDPSFSEPSFDEKEKRVSFSFPTAFPAGTQTKLTVGFAGELNSSMTGYYRSSFEEEGKTKYYSLTQFEATDARSAFPCWDEPALKATYTVTMVSKANTVNISNMPITSEKVFSLNDHPELKTLFVDLNEEWKVTKFETTPLMSSYLVAFANGPFEYLESSAKMPLSKRTIPLRIYATKDLIHQAQFALDVKAKVLPLYEKVFEVEYPLPKLDTLVANDFDAGAMENWGLITGRTSALLLDPKKADLAAKKRVVVVQSHEVAHMWFGNITTMEWWDYLYLNEGFATLMGEVIIEGAAFPEFKPNSEFITVHLNRALALDSKLSSHPIEVACPDAESIGQVYISYTFNEQADVYSQIFDGLSYSKAASVLRMLSAYVGEDKFLKGVSLYLKAHLYANSVTNDLWAGISKSTGADIINFMDNWVKKIGFPVVTVTETSEGIKVRQDRFLETGLAEGADNETIWNIPLSILTVDANGEPIVDKTAVLDAREKTFPLDTSKPYKLNAGTNGVYRVLYEDAHLSKIAAEVAKPASVFAVEDRMGLVNDVLALSKAALMKLSNALTLIDALRNEQEYLVWDGISANLSSLSATWWEDEYIRSLLDAFRISLFTPFVKKLGYEYPASENPDISQLRTRAIEQCLSAKDQSVIDELKDRFAQYMKNGDDSVIPADLQGAIYRAAVIYGGKDEFNAVKAIYDKAPTPTSRISAMIALCQTKDSALLDETYEIALKQARDQDVVYFLSGLASNDLTKRSVTRLFQDHYETLYKRFESTFMMRYLVETTYSGLSTQKDLDEMNAFFKDKDTSKYHMGLAQCLDSIRARIAYIKHSSSDVRHWLETWKESN
ncbi:leucyl aminopeptidase [Lentinula aciculospora]|uniref:Aminopeptidase n=1 Tax=Lentinula aciculospora TaxID=153920 RepID=A0A9W9AQG2_9AGAR|nr:leucyl aminopeptidase [Lentinula aciculospora]